MYSVLTTSVPFDRDHMYTMLSIVHTLRSALFRGLLCGASRNALLQ